MSDMTVVILPLLTMLAYVLCLTTSSANKRTIQKLAWKIEHRDEKYKRIVTDLIIEMIEQGREAKAVLLLTDPSLNEIKQIVLNGSGHMLCPNCETHIIPVSQDVCRLCSYQRNIDKRQLEKMVKEGAIKEVQHA